MRLRRSDSAAPNEISASGTHTSISIARNVNYALGWDRQLHHEGVAKSSTIPPFDYGLIRGVSFYDSVILHSEITDCDTLLLIFAGPGTIEVSENCTAEEAFSHRKGSLWIAHLEERVKEIAPINYHLCRVCIERDQERRVVPGGAIVLARVVRSPRFISAGTDPWRRLADWPSCSQRDDRKPPEFLEARLQIVGNHGPPTLSGHEPKNSDGYN